MAADRKVSAAIVIWLMLHKNSDYMQREKVRYNP